MSVTVEELPRAEPERWNGLVASTPHGTVYQTTYLAEYFGRYYGARPHFLVARAGGRLGGLLLLFEMGRYPDRDASRPWLHHLKKPLNAVVKVFRWYDGPVVLDGAHRREVVAAMLRKVDELARRDGIFTLQHGGLPIGDDSDGLAAAVDAGFEVDGWGTFVVDLRASLDELWSRLRASAARSAVRRGARLGLRAYDATAGVLDPLVRCEYEHGRARGIPSRPWARFAAMRDAMAPAGVYRVLAAECEGQVVAFTPLLMFNRTMHLMKPAQLPTCFERKVPAGDFLMWEAIKAGHTAGLDAFDLSGASPSSATEPERGIRFFKSKWGGQYVTYPVARKRYRSWPW